MDSLASSLPDSTVGQKRRAHATAKNAKPTGAEVKTKVKRPKRKKLRRVVCDSYQPVVTEVMDEVNSDTQSSDDENLVWELGLSGVEEAVDDEVETNICTVRDHGGSRNHFKAKRPTERVYGMKIVVLDSTEPAKMKKFLDYLNSRRILDPRPIHRNLISPTIQSITDSLICAVLKISLKDVKRFTDADFIQSVYMAYPAVRGSAEGILDMGIKQRLKGLPFDPKGPDCGLVARHSRNIRNKRRTETRR
jgi:hypothetical protein